MKFIIKCSKEIFSPREIQAIEKNGYSFCALTIGQRQPKSTDEKSFIDFIEGIRDPQTSAEKAWIKYLDQMKLEGHIAGPWLKLQIEDFVPEIPVVNPQNNIKDLEQLNIEFRKRFKLIHNVDYRFNIKYLFHFTDIENIESIKKHGLLPLSVLSENGIIPPKPGGNDLSHGLDRNYGLDKYVHLAFREFHPMEYRARQEERIAETRFLKISSEVINFGGALVTASVANKTDAELYFIEGSSAHIPYEIFSNAAIDFSNSKVRAEYSHLLKAEMLIPHPIHPKYILNL
jgi:hypothetical protein